MLTLFLLIICGLLTVGWLRSKKAALIITYFCISKFREPTISELKECEAEVTREISAEIVKRLSFRK